MTSVQFLSIQSKKFAFSLPFRYGYLSSEIFRACRLVVDTGLHAFGWTKEKAIQYMTDHTATSLESIRSEVRGLEIAVEFLGPWKGLRNTLTYVWNIIILKSSIHTTTYLLRTSWNELRVLANKFKNSITRKATLLYAFILQ